MEKFSEKRSSAIRKDAKYITLFVLYEIRDKLLLYYIFGDAERVIILHDVLNKFSIHMICMISMIFKTEIN